jgi:MFS family permease
MVSIGTEYYLPLYFQSVKQASPLRSGLLILPMMVTEATVDILAGILIHQTGRYIETTWIGVTLMTLGTGLYISIQPDTSVAMIIGFEIIGGIGTALLFQSPMISIQNTVSQADTATATATLGFIRNLATAISIVIGGVVFQNSMGARQSYLAAAGLSESVLEALSGDQAAANVEIIKSIKSTIQRQAVQEVFSWSLKKYVHNVHLRGGCCDSSKRFHQAATSENRAHGDEDRNTKVGGGGGLRVDEKGSYILD